jgi:alpha-tubulin suppressor-like RCC1 family protein
MARHLAAAGIAAMMVVSAGAAAASAGVRGSLAQPSGPKLESWGANFDGQLDNGHLGVTQLTPGPAETNTLNGPDNQISQVSVGCDHGVALTAGGQVLAWGSNKLGQVGMGDAGPIPFPQTVPIPAPVKSVKAGCQFSMALDFDGHVWTWGSNALGQLGTGSDQPNGPPTKVKLPQGTVVKAISAGEAFGVALNKSGKLFAWGIDDAGELGDGGHRKGSAIPVRVHLPSGITVTSVASGSDHSLALTSTGRVLAWGDNEFGQLGDGTGRERDTPVKITMPSSVQKVAQVIGGGVFSLALTAKGRLLSWGSNAFGELGDGTFTDRLRPVRVHQGSATVTAAVAGGLHVLARTSGGGILAWGINNDGQLGDGGTTSSNLPITPDIPIGTVVAVGAGSGSNSSFAIMR